MGKKAIECVDCGPGIPIETLTDRLVVGDRVAHIPGLEAIMDAVIKMRLSNHQQVGDELLRRVNESFEVPPDQEVEYRHALLDYYDRRVTEFA